MILVLILISLWCSLGVICRWMFFVQQVFGPADLKSLGAPFLVLRSVGVPRQLTVKKVNPKVFIFCKITSRTILAEIRQRLVSYVLLLPPVTLEG